MTLRIMLLWLKQQWKHKSLCFLDAVMSGSIIYVSWNPSELEVKLVWWNQNISQVVLIHAKCALKPFATSLDSCMFSQKLLQKHNFQKRYRRKVRNWLTVTYSLSASSFVPCRAQGQEFLIWYCSSTLTISYMTIQKVWDY